MPARGVILACKGGEDSMVSRYQVSAKEEEGIVFCAS